MRKLLLFLLISAFFLQAQDIKLSVPYERHTLKNGLTLILHADNSVPVVSVNTWYHVGSGNEKPGRTGFAHLFEHLMFEGSKNVPEGKFDEWLEAAGGDNNGSTTTDRTNYFENVPTNALELPLFLDSDRMGYLTDAMTPEKVNGQRDVVKNERRQSYENRPYGMVSIVLDESLYPTGHPYSWPTIGSMKDLNAASYEDVVQFFKTFYIPNNASVAIAGDIDINQTIKLVEKWFDEIPAGSTAPKLTTTEAKLGKEKRIAFEDKVQLPRLYMAWLTPAVFASGDAELDIVASVLAGGKNSRLYKRLVYEMQIAQDVSAYQASQKLSSTFLIVATARSGHTLTEIETVIQEELNKIKSTPPEQREVQRAINQYESSYLTRLENVSSKADLLNYYNFYAGEPDYFAKDLARYYKVTPEYVMATVKTFLKDDARVVLSVVPRGKKDLAAKSEFMSVEGK